MHLSIQNPFKSKPSFVQKEPGEGYDIWARNYDAQPGNLMLDFDEELFSVLLEKVDLESKHIADIGCGTGRHWKKLLAKKPASLVGYDVSMGMLKELNMKFPNANFHQINDNLFTHVQNEHFDVIILTLTIAHIENIGEALKSWARILKPGGKLLITDFHPVALSLGGKRTFKENSNTISITNYIHSIDFLKNILAELNLDVINEHERVIDEKVRHYYQHQNALHVYNQFAGVPMIYGLLIKKHA